MKLADNRRGVVTVMVVGSFGIVIGAFAIGITAGYYRVAKNIPVIHDITTDTVDPPPFVALLPERNASPNGAGYGGPEVAVKQLNAYPDIAPIETGLSLPEAFDRALIVTREMKLKLVDSNEAGGRIEATDTTRWLRFKDDVVIRIATGAAGKARIDLRSVSRFGIGDLGTNAARIREFTRRYARLPSAAETAPTAGITPAAAIHPAGSAPPAPGRSARLAGAPDPTSPPETAADARADR